MSGSATVRVYSLRHRLRDIATIG